LHRGPRAAEVLRRRKALDRASGVFQAVGAGCFEIDSIDGQCVMDGFGGARISNAVPNFDIANGAPTGGDATNELVDAWTSDAFGLNSEKTLVTWSMDEGSTWHDPVIASDPDVRSMYSAPAISPDGKTVYVVEEELGAPFRGGDMLAPRPYRGVLRQATVGPD